MKTVALALDHAGEPLLETAKDAITRAGASPLHLGADLVSPTDDYPDFARLVAQAIHEGRAHRAILICGSGVGASVAVNKFMGIRAAVCHDTYSAAQGVEHDDMNVLCLGARIIGVELARTVMHAFLGAGFTGEERHKRRLAKIAEFEQARG